MELKTIESNYPNVKMTPGEWGEVELEIVDEVLEKLVAAFGSTRRLSKKTGKLEFSVVADDSLSSAEGKKALATALSNQDGSTTIKFSHEAFRVGPKRFGPTIHPGWNVLHEVGHAMDHHGAKGNRAKYRSQQFVERFFKKDGDKLKNREEYHDKDYEKGMRPGEAYANAFAAYILGHTSGMGAYMPEKYEIVRKDIQKR